MVREIKFRAWDIVCKEWRYSNINGLSAFFKGVEDGDLINVCEFIGLKDCKGKEIYGGDIVKASQWEYAKEHFKPLGKKLDYEGIFLIEIIFGHWGLETHWKHISGYECSTHIMRDEDENGNMIQIEIIGNIYKNPELLGGKK